MKIKELKIKNFRIFKGEYKFDFDNKDLIVICGNNGNGKSTIFDSIEWAMTGELQRYKGSMERNKFNYIFNNKVYGTSECEVFVEIVFEHCGQTLVVKRKCKCNKVGRNPKSNVYINGIEYKEQEGSKKIRELITNDVKNEECVDKAKFRDMFSATQMLSQDEISDFVSSKKPSDRLQVIEKIFGVDRYGENFRAYIKEKGSILESKIVRESEQQDEYIKQIVDLRNKIVNLKTKKEAIENNNTNLGLRNENDIIKQYDNLKEKEAKLIIVNNHETYNTVNEKLQEEVIDNKKAIDELLKEKEAFLNKVIRFKQDCHINKDIQLNIKTLEKLNLTNKNRVEKRNKSILLYQKKIMKLETVLNLKSSIENYDKLIIQSKKEIEYKDNQINSLKELKSIQDIKNKYINIEDFQKDYIGFETKKKELQNRLKYMNLKNEINLLKNENIDNQKNIEQSNKRLKEIENSLKEIDDNLLRNKAKTNKNFKEISQKVFEIQNDIIEKNNCKICPVCGEDYINVSTLVEKVAIQLQISKDKLNNIENNIRNQMLQKGKLEQEKNELNDKIIFLLEQIDKNNRVINKKIINIGKSELLISNYDNCSIDEIKNNLCQTKIFLEKNRLAFEVVNNIIELENNIKKIDSDRISYESLKSKIYKDYEVLNKNLRKSNDEIKIKKLKYENYIINAKRSVEIYHQRIIENKEIISDLDVIYKKLNLDKQNIVKVIGDFENNEECLNSIITKINDDINYLKNIEVEIKELLSSINKLLTQNDVNNINKEIVKLTKSEELLVNKVTELDNKIDCYSKDRESLDTILDESKDIQSELIGDLIENYSDYIDRLFFQISPHAFAKHIYMIPKKTDLYIILSEKKGRRKELISMEDEELKKEANASLTLSSAQINVLGICIFISLSLSQEWTKLEMMGIDDPFQNMDDINVYSFLDTLSGILHKKQVMISTHNEDFAALISNKSILEKEKIKTIQLETYSEDGVKYVESE